MKQGEPASTGIAEWRPSIRVIRLAPKSGLMSSEYIEEADVPKLFSTGKSGRRISLVFGKARPIKMGMPLKLDLQLARVCGMMPDGSLSKCLSGVSFCQGKDRKKVVEFGEILKERFDVSPRYYHMERYDVVSIGNKSLCAFLHLCLDVHKSDEPARIPGWIKNSSLDILREYLRYAFAMEGSVCDPRKGGKEIKFHSCDKSFVMEIRDVILARFGIASHIQEYTIKGYGKKYYLSITGKDNILKFAEIG
ncbi:MAG: LAGLIDADG family homing endonuclease, partial [Candidatus Aenigmatarchaeota archaeon]